MVSCHSQRANRHNRAETSDLPCARALYATEPEWTTVVHAATDMRDMLKELGLTSFVKMTGGKGLHVAVPIKPQLEWEATKQFTKTIATKFAARAPDLYVTNMSMKVRKGEGFGVLVNLPPEDGFASYTADLYNPAGKLEWSSPVVAPSDQGRQIYIPRADRRSGTYTLVVKGITANGESKEIARQPVDVQIQN